MFTRILDCAALLYTEECMVLYLHVLLPLKRGLFFFWDKLSIHEFRAYINDYIYTKSWDVIAHYYNVG